MSTRQAIETATFVKTENQKSGTTKVSTFSVILYEERGIFFTNYTVHVSGDLPYKKLEISPSKKYSSKKAAQQHFNDMEKKVSKFVYKK